MSCLICAGDADTIESLMNWEERVCAQCGRYRISRALIFELMEEGQIFDTQRMRQWLAQRRAEVDIPYVERRNALLVN